MKIRQNTPARYCPWPRPTYPKINAEKRKKVLRRRTRRGNHTRY
jgi:hypothetical protein